MLRWFFRIVVSILGKGFRANSWGKRKRLSIIRCRNIWIAWRKIMESFMERMELTLKKLFCRKRWKFNRRELRKTIKIPSRKQALCTWIVRISGKVRRWYNLKLFSRNKAKIRLFFSIYRLQKLNRIWINRKIIKIF